MTLVCSFTCREKRTNHLNSDKNVDPTLIASASYAELSSYVVLNLLDVTLHNCDVYGLRHNHQVQRDVPVAFISTPNGQVTVYNRPFWSERTTAALVVIVAVLSVFLNDNAWATTAECVVVRDGTSPVIIESKELWRSCVLVFTIPLDLADIGTRRAS